MKKLLFILPLVLAIFNLNNLQAQGYIRGGAGAGFNVTEDAFAIPALRRDSNDLIISQRTIFGGFGQGARFSIAGGYMITPYFGIELEFYYFQGFKQEYGSDADVDNYQRTGYSYQMRMIPSLVLQVPLEGKFQPYARFGVLLPFWGKTIIEESWTYENNPSTVSRSKQTDVEGKFSVGFESTMGVQYNITDNLGIYIQATYTALRIKSDKATVVKDDQLAKDGTTNSNLTNAQIFMTQIQFQDEMTKSSNYQTFLGGLVPEDMVVKIDGTFDPNKPLNLPTQSSAFNSLSFSVGVKYTFNKKK